MKKANIQTGVAELKKVWNSCKDYAVFSDAVISKLSGYEAGRFSKDDVLKTIAALRKKVSKTKNIYDQIEDACKRIEDSIKED